MIRQPKTVLLARRLRLRLHPQMQRWLGQVHGCELRGRLQSAAALHEDLVTAVHY